MHPKDGQEMAKSQRAAPEEGRGEEGGGAIRTYAGHDGGASPCSPSSLKLSDTQCLLPTTQWWLSAHTQQRSSSAALLEQLLLLAGCLKLLQHLQMLEHALIEGT